VEGGKGRKGLGCGMWHGGVFQMREQGLGQRRIGFVKGAMIGHPKGNQQGRARKDR
jgi:hypothetical protein